MTAVSLSTIRDDIQSTVYDILSTDTTVKTYTENVYDGRPPKMAEGIGFPYIIVHTPSISREKLTFTNSITNRRYSIECSTTLEVYSKKEGDLRKLMDAIEDSLFRGQDTTRGKQLFDLRIESDDPRSQPRTDGTNVWTINIIIYYIVRGCNESTT
jgi:hypothetical protein